LLKCAAPSSYFAIANHTGEICWHQEVNLSDNFSRILDTMVRISLKERFHTVDDVIFALGTESDSPMLTNCLTTQRLRSKSQPIEKTTQTYIPPVARTAIAIRAWKAKIKGKKPSYKFNNYLSSVSN
jgi:hypothetical protein